MLVSSHNNKGNPKKSILKVAPVFTFESFKEDEEEDEDQASFQKDYSNRASECSEDEERDQVEVKSRKSSINTQGSNSRRQSLAASQTTGVTESVQNFF